jgi:hypothetical protein
MSLWCKSHRHPIMEAGDEIVGRAGARVCDRLHSVGALVAAGMRRHAARLDRQREGEPDDVRTGDGAADRTCCATGGERRACRKLRPHARSCAWSVATTPEALQSAARGKST